MISIQYWRIQLIVYGDAITQAEWTERYRIEKAKDAIALNMMSNEEEAVVTVQKGDVVVTRHLSCDMGICSKANMGESQLESPAL